MNRRRFPAGRAVSLGLALLVLSCASSGRRVYVNPAADMAFYKKVAVIPFANMSGDGLAGQRVTRAFITELIMTDRYQIVQPEEFRNALSKVNGLPGPDGSYDPEKLKEAAAQLGATGILRGAVTEYQMQRSSGGSEIPILAPVRAHHNTALPVLVMPPSRRGRFVPGCA